MPLIKGYSRATISKNIRKMMDEGYKQPQAVAASLGNALETFKKRHPRKALPEYLRKTEWLKEHRQRRRNSTKKKAARRVVRKKRNPTIKGPIDHLIQVTKVDDYGKSKVGYFDGFGFDTSPRVASRFHSKAQAEKVMKALKKDLQLKPPTWHIKVIKETELPGYKSYDH